MKVEAPNGEKLCFKSDESRDVAACLGPVELKGEGCRLESELPKGESPSFGFPNGEAVCLGSVEPKGDGFCSESKGDSPSFGFPNGEKDLFDSSLPIFDAVVEVELFVCVMELDGKEEASGGVDAFESNPGEAAFAVFALSEMFSP